MPKKAKHTDAAAALIRVFAADQELIAGRYEEMREEEASARAYSIANEMYRAADLLRLYPASKPDRI